MALVCVCNNLEEDIILSKIKETNVKSIKELQKHLSVCNECGTCGKYIKFLIDENEQSNKENI